MSYESTSSAEDVVSLGAAGRALTRLGRSTLVTETSTNPSIVVCIVVLETAISLPEVHDLLRERLLRQHPRYRSVVEQQATWLELPMKDISLERHVTVHPLADPESQQELNDFLGYYSVAPMPPDQPLWDVALIPQFRGGSALVLRQHHCISDGRGGKVIVDSISDSPSRWAAGRPPTVLQWLTRRLQAILLVLLSSPFVLFVSLQALLFADRPGPLKPAALDGRRRKVGVSRPIPIAQAKAISKSLGCTLNDLGLALFTAALREQSLALGGPATAPIWAGIPVDVRIADEVYTGNKFGFAACRLPLHLSDVPSMVKYIHAKMDFVKHHHVAQVMYFISRAASFVFPARLLKAILSYGSNGVSVVVTNVAGSGRQMSFKGHPSSHIFILVPPPPTVGVGCSITSHRDRMVFAMVVDVACGVDPVSAVQCVEDRLTALATVGTKEAAAR